jgi:hypothetical protein
MSLLVLVFILVLLFGGLGYHSGWSYYGAGPYGGIGSLLVLILTIVFITGLTQAILVFGVSFCLGYALRRVLRLSGRS